MVGRGLPRNNVTLKRYVLLLTMAMGIVQFVLHYLMCTSDKQTTMLDGSYVAFEGIQGIEKHHDDSRVIKTFKCTTCEKRCDDGGSRICVIVMDESATGDLPKYKHLKPCKRAPSLSGRNQYAFDYVHVRRWVSCFLEEVGKQEFHHIPLPPLAIVKSLRELMFHVALSILPTGLLFNIAVIAHVMEALMAPESCGVEFGEVQKSKKGENGGGGGVCDNCCACILYC